MAEVSPFAQFGLVGLIVGTMLGVFGYLIKRMLDHLLSQHSEISRTRLEEMKNSIERFGERLGKVEQQLAALRAIEDFSKAHHIKP